MIKDASYGPERASAGSLASPAPSCELPRGEAVALGGIIPARSAILMSEEFSGSGADLFKIACEHELEGIVSKRLDKPYPSGRRTEWLKTKCVQTDEFVIIGYQPTSRAVRGSLANIKVATFDSERLRWRGSARAFPKRVARLRASLDEIAAQRCLCDWAEGFGCGVALQELRAEIA